MRLFLECAQIQIQLLPYFEIFDKIIYKTDRNAMLFYVTLIKEKTFF